MCVRVSAALQIETIEKRLRAASGHPPTWAGSPGVQYEFAVTLAPPTTGTAVNVQVVITAAVGAQHPQHSKCHAAGNPISCCGGLPAPAPTTSRN